MIGSNSGNPFVEWYLSTLRPGGNPTLVADYSLRTPYARGASGAVSTSQDFSYEDLLKFANADERATLLVTAILFSGNGLATPLIGRQVSIPLIDVKDGITAAADKAAADKAAADKAAADKAAADKAAADKAAADKAAAELEVSQESQVKAAIKTVRSITCTRGKSILKISSRNLKCPKGYKRR